MKVCKNCSKEIDKKAVICPQCGVKIKKPIYKKIWFWIIITIIVIAVAASGGDSTTKTPLTNSAIENVEYTIVNIDTLFKDLKANALKAEKTYQDNYIEITGYISNIDSDGSYISINSKTDEYWLDSIMCDIKSDEQLKIVMEKSEGDEVTIKGQITDIGEVMGYSLDIHEIK